MERKGARKEKNGEIYDITTVLFLFFLSLRVEDPIMSYEPFNFTNHVRSSNKIQRLVVECMMRFG